MARSKGQISTAQKAKALSKRPRKARQGPAIMFAENDPENEHVPAIREHDDLEVLASMKGFDVDSPTGTLVSSPVAGNLVEVTVEETNLLPELPQETKQYISKLTAQITTLAEQLCERHADTSHLIRLLEKNQRRLRLQAYKLAPLRQEVFELRPLKDEVVMLRGQVTTLETAARENTSVNTSRQPFFSHDALLVSRDAALVLGSESYKVTRPTGGSGTRIAVNPLSVLEHYTDQQLDVIFHPSVDPSGTSLCHNVLRTMAIGQFCQCPEVSPAANAMITRDGMFFESISRISADQAASVSSRVFFTRTSSPAQFARFSSDGGMLWDFPQVSLWLSQASHAAVTYATQDTIPSQFAGIDFVKFTPIAQQSVEGTLARSQLLAGLLGSSGCSVTAFAIQGSIRAPNEFFDALRNMGHTFCLLFDDDEHSMPWRTLMDTIVNVLVLHSAAQRSVQFLVFSFNLCLQQWGLTLQKLNTYRGIPVRVLDQRFAKLLLEQMTSVIPLKALDQHQFETAAAASITTVTIAVPFRAAPSPVNTFTEFKKQTENPVTSPEYSPTVCFSHLDSLLLLDPSGCVKQKCKYAHPSIEEVRSNKGRMASSVNGRADRLIALEQL